MKSKIGLMRMIPKVTVWTQPLYVVYCCLLNLLICGHNCSWLSLNKFMDRHPGFAFRDCTFVLKYVLMKRKAVMIIDNLWIFNVLMLSNMLKFIGFFFLAHLTGTQLTQKRIFCCVPSRRVRKDTFRSNNLITANDLNIVRTTNWYVLCRCYQRKVKSLKCVFLEMYICWSG